MVLKDIAIFHNRHRHQPLYKCCHDFNRIKLPSQALTSDIKEKYSTTVSASSDEDCTDKYVRILNFYFLFIF